MPKKKYELAKCRSDISSGADENKNKTYQKFKKKANFNKIKLRIG